LSTDTAASNFPIITLSLVSGIVVGVAGIFFKLREIAKDQRKDLESKLTEKINISQLAEQLKFLIAQQDKKIDRLEEIIFHLPPPSDHNDPL